MLTDHLLHARHDKTQALISGRMKLQKKLKHKYINHKLRNYAYLSITGVVNINKINSLHLVLSQTLY